MEKYRNETKEWIEEPKLPSELDVLMTLYRSFSITILP